MDFEDPIPEQVRARIPSLRELNEKYREEEKKRKTDYSNASIQSVYDQHRKSRQSGQSLEQLTQKELGEIIEKRITARISLCVLHRDRRNKEVEELTDGKGILPKDQYISARQNLEGQVDQISLQLIALKRRKNEIKGMILDRRVEYRYHKDIDVLVDQIIENAIATYKIALAGYDTVLPGNRKSSSQSIFRRMLVEFYSAEPPPDEGSSSSDEDEHEYKLSYNRDEPEFSRGIWCPISKGFFCSELITAAHLVPHSIGEISCSYLFNEEHTTGHLFNPENGLLMLKFFKEAIDKAQIAIVPVEGEVFTSDVKVVVLDRAILKRNPVPYFDLDWKSLDGLQLEFRNENRPSLRHLYFNFLLSTFRKRRFECTGWRSDQRKYAQGKMWGSPGNRWLRGPSIRAIARRLGHELDLESFLDTADLPLSENGNDNNDGFDDELLAEETITGEQLVVTEKASDDEEESEED